MPRFKSKIGEFEAIQFPGPSHVPGRLSAFLAFDDWAVKHLSKVECRYVGDRFFITMRITSAKILDIVEVLPGNYIIKDRDSYFYAINENLFDYIFESV